MKKLHILLILLAVIAILTGSCSTSKTSTTSTNSTSTTSLTNTSSTGATTYESLAAQGKTVYTTSCASCHGNNGQGANAPALWGSGANLAKYNTAQGLLSFISATMPKTAPGSLSHQQYLNVLCNILVQGNQVTGSNAFNENQLGSITLK
jgi:mono/diheme cytochrome c family protein